MRRDGSAYAALGLQPDADSRDIDRAYKRLIKLHHPDREGGSADRAAEINRAYRELRGRPDPQQALVLYEGEVAEAAGRGWVRAAAAMIVAVLALLVVTGPGAAVLRQLSRTPQFEVGHVALAAGTRDVMDQSIHDSAVLGGVREAMRVSRSGDDAALLSASRDCHRQLRTEPSLDQLDRCAAFDDAVVQLQDRDPMWDGGPFSQLAVSNRQWTAASALSNDYLAVDGRLDRIRLQVELALAPREPPQAPATAKP